MTMLSFRVEAREAAQLELCIRSLGVARSEFLRTALRRYIERLWSERDADTWEDRPLDEAERSLGQIADWGPAEDWSDWADAAG